MKTKINNYAMCAHVWAQQTQDSGAAGRVFFHGDTIYSYGRHFPIARIITSKRTGRKIVLFNARGYSSSTANHKSTVRQAVCHMVLVEVTNPESLDHKANHQDFKARYEQALTKAASSRSRVRAERALGEAEDIRVQACAYSEFFNLRWTMKPPKDVEKILEATKKRLEEAKARQRKEMAERAAKWLAGDTSVNIINHPDILLRTRGDILETSRGAQVPLDHAKKAFKVVARCKRTKREYVRNGHTVHVGNFSIDRIDATGDLHAGCHHIKWGEIERIAQQLSLI